MKNLKLTIPKQGYRIKFLEKIWDSQNGEFRIFSNMKMGACQVSLKANVYVKILLFENGKLCDKNLNLWLILESENARQKDYIYGKTLGI